MSCSMRILPFFATPGYFNGSWVIDGGFSAVFTIPPDSDPSKVIKVTPASTIDADIHPCPYSLCFHIFLMFAAFSNFQFCAYFHIKKI